MTKALRFTWVLLIPLLLYSMMHVGYLFHSYILAAPFVLLALLLSIAIQVAYRRRVPFSLRSMLWIALLSWGVVDWRIEYLAILAITTRPQFSPTSDYVISGTGYLMVFMYTWLLVYAIPHLRVNSVSPAQSVNAVQAAPVQSVQQVKTAQPPPVQNTPARCSACLTRSIDDAHYQLCSVCKKQYASEIQRVRTQLYRARKAGTPATLTIGEWIQTLQAFNFLCSYCQRERYAVMEHFIPISRGGGTTKENCTPACRHCNEKKQAEHPERLKKEHRS